MNIEKLKHYAKAWNAHDIEKIMSYMTDDCVFKSGGGSMSFGTRYQGQSEVRERFQAIWTEFPDVRFKNLRHFLQGDRGCSEWTFVATNADGTRLEIDGCDLFRFTGGKIAEKNTFLKNRS